MVFCQVEKHQVYIQRKRRAESYICQRQLSFYKRADVSKQFFCGKIKSAYLLYAIRGQNVGPILYLFHHHCVFMLIRVSLFTMQEIFCFSSASVLEKVVI